jgi:glycosyltransferase involved in cell wall biosynthesis
MKIGVAIEETWRFFNEIYEDLSLHYQTSLFNRRVVHLPFFNERINRFVFNYDLNAFISHNDVAFFEWAGELLVSASQLKKHASIVTRLHRYEMYQWVDKINWDAVVKIILVSQAKKCEFVDRFPDQAKKIAVIPVGVNLRKFQPDPHNFRGDIGILCDLSPRKRVYELILTFSEIVKLHEELHLHIGGGILELFKDYYYAIEYLIKKLNLQNKVTLYGNVIDPQNWFHNIDIFISNSYSEGLQVAPMEAIASGCFSLSHHWFGANELLPEEFLFFTEKELQEKILTYCNLSEADKCQKREYLRNFVKERFDIDQVKFQIRSIIEEAR